jgi:hypothetical protein
VLDITWQLNPETFLIPRLRLEGAQLQYNGKISLSSVYVNYISDNEQRPTYPIISQPMSHIFREKPFLLLQRLNSKDNSVMFYGHKLYQMKKKKMAISQISTADGSCVRDSNTV